MKLIALSLLLALTTACGLKDENDDSQESSGSFTEEENLETVSLSLDESMDLLADSGDDNGESGLSLLEATVTKTCTPVDQTAKVEFKNVFDSTIENSSRFGSFKQTMQREASVTRLWSQAGVTIGCHSNGKNAQIDFTQGMEGLKTDIDFSRTSERSSTRTKKNGTVVEKSMTMKSVGERTVAWESVTPGADGSVVRVKSVTTQSTIERSTKSGEDVLRSMKASVSTAEGAPLKIAVEFASALSGDPVSRTIQSGKILAAVEGKGRIESEFSNLKVKFSSEGCEPASGSVISSVFAEGETTASIVMKIEAEDGSYVATNITDSANPVVVEDFEYQLCDIRDFGN